MLKRTEPFSDDPETYDLDQGFSAKSDTRPQAVVIGAGLGGLASAMRLGAKGYRVEVIDRLDSVGGRGTSVSVNGHRFDLGPTIVTVPNCFKDLWAVTDHKFEDDVDLRPLDPFYTIRFPDGSQFSARKDHEDMRAEVKRLSQHDLAGYDKIVKDAEARYVFGFEDLGRRPMNELWELIKVLPTFAWYRADRSVYAHAAKRLKDERLRMALSFHPLFIGGDPFHVTSMYTLVSHLEKEFGVHYAMGGVAAIAEAMAKRIRGQGGRIRLNEEVDQILIKNNTVKGVELKSGDTLDAPIVVSNADAGHTYDHLLRRTKKRRWTPKKLASRRWSMGLFIWYFGTKGTREKWRDVGHHTILSGPRYKGLVRDIFMKGKLCDDMSLYVHRPTETDPSAAPEGDDTFYALSPVPHLGFENGVDWKVEAEPYRQKVQAFLEKEMLPGLGEHITASHVMTPLDFQDRYLSPYGSGFSIEPRILQSAWFRPHNVSEEVKGLYLAGAGTHPGAGLPGVVSSAEVLAKLVPDAERVSA